MFAIFRCAKLYRGNGTASFSRSMRHLREHSRTVSEISKPELTHHNMQKIMAQDAAQSLLSSYIDEHNKNNKRKHRKDAAVAVEFIFSYTPDPSNQTHEFAQQFQKKIDDFMHEHFPHMQKVAIARHCDELSFHWHIIAIPYDKTKKRLSAKDQIGGPKELRQLQTDFANECKDLGLKRGISKEITKSIHKTKAEYNRQKLVQKKQIQKEAHAALEDIFGDR